MKLQCVSMCVQSTFKKSFKQELFKRFKMMFKEFNNLSMIWNCQWNSDVNEMNACEVNRTYKKWYKYKNCAKRCKKCVRIMYKLIIVQFITLCLIVSCANYAACVLETHVLRIMCKSLQNCWKLCKMRCEKKSV